MNFITVNHLARHIVYIYNVNDLADVLRDFILTNNVFNATFYSMVEIICTCSQDKIIQFGEKYGILVQSDNQPSNPVHCNMNMNSRCLIDCKIR
jgi:hypothetical protein